jgi:hypothetical protein
MAVPIKLILAATAIVSVAGVSFFQGRAWGLRAGERKAAEMYHRALEANRRTENAYLEALDDLGNRLRDAKRLHGNKCVPIPARKPDASGECGGYAGSYGADDFLEYGAECERYRLNTKALQDLAKEAR